ncbi:MAG: ATP-binding protein [Ruminococcus sp.]|nr:ATP-binding protein [Ruminococcus sp.]
MTEDFFDFIIDIDIGKSMYRKYSEKKDIPYFLPDRGKFETFLHGMKSMICGSKDAFMRNMKLIRILSGLEAEKKYTIFFRLKIQESVYDKKMVFFYGAKEETIIGLCEDITGSALAGAKEGQEQGKEAGAAAAKEAERLRAHVAYFAHEIRTSLQSIHGSLAIFRLGETDRELHLDNAFYAAEHLLRLVNSALDISMLESDTHVTKIEAVTLQDLVQYPYKVVGLPARERDIDLRFYPGEPVYRYLYLNKDMVWHILINLLSNAIKYTDSGGKVECRITETYLEEKRVKLLLEVEDTGIGMETGFLSNVWKAYAREQRMRESQGSGLGLMLTKRMVELLNGRIVMSSHAGAGTIVCVELEVDGDDVLYTSVTPPAEKKRSTELLRQGFIRRALVAEDEEANMEIICRYLERLGVIADKAYNGAEAIRIFESSGMHYYHIILMDMNMPDKDGAETIQTIRCMDRPDCGLPIVAVTAQIPDKEKEDMFLSQIDGYLVKPYCLEDICDVLTKCQNDK